MHVLWDEKNSVFCLTNIIIVGIRIQTEVQDHTMCQNKPLGRIQEIGALQLWTEEHWILETSTEDIRYVAYYEHYM